MELKDVLVIILLSLGVQSLVLPDGTLQLAPLDAHASEWVSNGNRPTFLEKTLTRDKC